MSQSINVTEAERFLKDSKFKKRKLKEFKNKPLDADKDPTIIDGKYFPSNEFLSAK